MDTNKFALAILLAPFLLFGFMFLFWFGFDHWMGWKEKRKVEINHTYHVISGLWSLLITYAGFHFYGNYSLLVSLIVAIVTAALYFALSLWDIRFASIHEKRQEPEYLLYGFAKTYLFFTMSISCIMLMVGIGLLVITLLNLSGDVRSYIAFFMLVCVYLLLSFLFSKKIPSWEKQSRQ